MNATLHIYYVEMRVSICDLHFFSETLILSWDPHLFFEIADFD